MAEAELKGFEEPRIYTPPKQELTPETTYGYSVIQFVEEVLGWTLFPWQKWFYIHALECNEDGTFRFRKIVLLIARQNGKSTVVEILTLWAMFVMGLALVLGTAQSLDTSEETWQGAVDIAEGNEELAPMVDRVVRVNGKKELRLVSGERYKVAAASRKGARGKTSDLVVLDELREHLNWEAWGAVTKTTNARSNALIMCMSNAGDAYSVVLRHLRYKAHMALGDPDGWCASAGDVGGEDGEEDFEDDTLAIFEWSAAPNRDKWDRVGWQEANPSMGYGTISERVIAADCATDPEPTFRTEDLCQWVETLRPEPFPEGAWDGGTDPKSEIAKDSELYWGVDVASDRAKSTIAVCGKRQDGLWHIEVVARRVGNEWIERELESLAAKWGTLRVAFQERGAPVSAIGDKIAAIKGIEAHPIGGANLTACCGRFWDSVAASAPESEDPDEVAYDAVRVTHRPQPTLDAAARVAATRPLGDGAWAWDRGRSPEDISPLVACTMAFGLATSVDEIKKPIKSAYSAERGVMFV